MGNNPEKKYLSLAAYFRNAVNNRIILTFQEIEQIIGHQLPNAAYLNKSWWKKTKPPAKHFHAWTRAGYAVEDVEPGGRVIFVRTDDSQRQPGQTGGLERDTVLVRSAEPDDARSVIDLQRRVEAASSYMLYSRDERNTSTQNMRKQLAEWKKSGTSLVLIAILNGRQAGYLFFIGNSAKRAAHRAAIVVGVLPEFQGRGIGQALLKKAEESASHRQVSRLELTVAAENKAAIHLYEKAGYMVEGTRRHALLIDGQLQDELYMAKLLD
ncbi:GNAT family N-acetyltransferase [Planococcus lenghuensis]|uniref:GNAT family N-acetyltransferase n=1 Tax=Planococcus lenghuensis TaxID=2213202 RepID=A0A1Q2KV38_9BACL|nr:GNAT family N-acetyltransferase [Planococcus lenghuensis]AQQ52088.1 GNAT family N-acetyltransferase [Planococcus lenghuensis]